MTEPTKLVYLSAQVPHDLMEQFKAVAAEHERNVSAELRHIMRAHVEAHANSESKAVS